MCWHHKPTHTLHQYLQFLTIVSYHYNSTLMHLEHGWFTARMLMECCKQCVHRVRNSFVFKCETSTGSQFKCVTDMLWENASNKTNAVIKPFHIGVWAQMVSVALLAFDSTLRYIQHIWYTWVNTCDPLLRPHVYLQYSWAAWTKGRALSPLRPEGMVSVDICPTWAWNKSVKVRDKWVNRRLAL